jgi:hypothetical protein
MNKYFIIHNQGAICGKKWAPKCEGNKKIFPVKSETLKYYNAKIMFDHWLKD